MAAQRSYYDILGLPRTASLEEIKKRYRELARRHHPDVNRDKAGASQIFAEINRAYAALSHPEERAAYDADLTLRERRAAPAQAGHPQAGHPQAGHPQAGHPQAGTRGAASGFPGGAAPQPARPAAAGAPRGTPRGAPPRSATPPGSADTMHLLAEAQSAFAHGKFIEARALCEHVLRRDGRSARAYEILGDVYRLQGRTDDAVHMYTMALQLNPRNQTVMQRLERLSGLSSASAQRVFFDNSARAGSERGPTRESGPVRRSAPHEKRSLATLIVGTVGYGVTFLLILYIALFNGKPLSDAPPFLGPVSSWSGMLIAVMVLTGLVLGFTLASTAAVRRIDDELILPGARAGSSAFLPLGLVLIVVSVLSFYAAALLYAVIGFLQESFTPSMGRVFGVVIAVVLLLTAVYEPGRDQVFLFGGNVVFLALLVGWALGDFFRPDGL